jgi:hypothetical protein
MSEIYPVALKKRGRYLVELRNGMLPGNPNLSDLFQEITIFRRRVGLRHGRGDSGLEVRGECFCRSENGLKLCLSYFSSTLGFLA